MSRKETTKAPADAGNEPDQEFNDWRDPNSKFEWLRDWFMPRPRRPDASDMPADRTAIDTGIPATMSVALAQIVLEEARRIYAHRDERLNRIESRATTLQATVGIATTLLLAAAALILDSAKIHDSWRPVWACVLSVLIVCLVMTGWLAARATLKPYERARIRSRDVVQRFTAEDENRAKRLTDTASTCLVYLLAALARPRDLDVSAKACGERLYQEAQRYSSDRHSQIRESEHLRQQAVDLHVAANYNGKLVMARAATLVAARRWYRLALGLILLLAPLLTMYPFIETKNPAGMTPTTSTTETKTTGRTQPP